MQYILSEEEYSKLVPREKAFNAINNMVKSMVDLRSNRDNLTSGPFGDVVIIRMTDFDRVMKKFREDVE